MTIALDTNILVYATGVDDEHRQRRAIDLLARIDDREIILPVQVLGEYFRVLTKLSHREAASIVLAWRTRFDCVDTSAHVLEQALQVTTDHHLSIWDAIVLASAAEAGCSMLISEDMHNGFTWAGVTIVDPFALPAHPLLTALLGE